MSSYTIAVTLNQPCLAAVDAVRAALGDRGFGVLTEIDLQAALTEKLDVDIEPQVILGACRPPLAYEAIQAEPSIAAEPPLSVSMRCTVTPRSANHVTALRRTSVAVSLVSSSRAST